MLKYKVVLQHILISNKKQCLQMEKHLHVTLENVTQQIISLVTKLKLLI